MIVTEIQIALLTASLVFILIEPVTSSERAVAQFVQAL
jgi:hypothetical protein